ncbi:hypothetical protein POJ06DRAFT_252776 [Lipomyces tetrasporus]|uniref:DUF1690-domain-containing protein n=1 Tax=Lipomyces tetrasporus TaxID=54092 RepID=A0AAD7VRY2_9ASCO|nr:uncharacterized protein POJ06DRAFT_252776 [Lipomyces tetrasporus]KAJ8100462.1 hypothetical protein POJ06DRAFT_252776 [Lipomyces tetrasporus]
MGASESKPAMQRTFVPEVPVQFSQDLIEVMEEIPESDFTRLQDKALKLESSVSSELEKITSEAHAILSASWSASASMPPADPESLTSPALLSDIETFKNHLVDRKHMLEKRAELSKKTGYEAPREKLIECLAKNDRRPLMCLDEFNAFKEKLESTIA